MERILSSAGEKKLIMDASQQQNELASNAFLPFLAPFADQLVEVFCFLKKNLYKLPI